ncbi:hypothetical protein [Bradyrhizobium sp. 2S1]|uniref:hypothetical protein n=1 Tax=Bradyrhizobium sp. 2S1 TaxID=1404429 RepID=UPI00140976C1|nr:hypothetical protein [Bradyrhizobium sp. 2S1]MCK7665834.1 hypothetical protein [Bradyrhizobium sp. 2S1]
MVEKLCEDCGTPFLPRQANQRFCCNVCNVAYFAAERREAVRQLRERQDAGPRTYFDLARGDAAETDDRPAVIGAAPPQLAAPQWALDAAALPPERPLGIDVNGLPDMETCHWESDAVGPRGKER